MNENKKSKTEQELKSLEPSAEQTIGSLSIKQIDELKKESLRAKAKACSEEVKVILQKHNCAIEPVITIFGTEIRASISFVPLQDPQN